MSALEGVADLEKKLLQLGQVAAVPILRAAVRAGIKPALERARELIPVGTQAHRTYKGRLVAPGFAKRNLRVITTASSDGRTVSAALGFRREAFYARFLETGTAKMSARPWLRPAFSGTQEKQLSAFNAYLKAKVDKVMGGG